MLLPAALQQIPGPVVTRFAPSTTGFLHLGHAAHALAVWGIARALGGRVLLRIEDHDQSRHREEYERAILEDMDWLGFSASPDTEPGVLNQRSRKSRYLELAEELAGRGLAYGCDCSRRKVVARTGPQPGELRYDNHCRERGLPLSEGVCWRMRLPSETVACEDAGRGGFTQHPQSQCGDPAIRDREGNWTYQFAVVADDWDQGVNLVVRGEDLIDSTGRQILMARMLGRAQTPAFFHHSLLVDPATRKKLSKRERSESIVSRREAGASAESILAEAAAGFGIAPPCGRPALGDWLALFRLSR